MSADGARSEAEVGEVELKHGALGFGSALIIGLNSTAPVYSLAAVVGLIAAEVGFQAPAILLLSFIPMLCVATAYYAMNRADPDCGTTFAWATRALGPTTGWLAGWAIMTAGVIVIGLLANTAATYTFLLFGWESAAESKAAVIVLAVLMIVGATYLTLIGIEVSAKTQLILTVAQVGALVIFSLVVLVRVFIGEGVGGSTEPELSWFSPFAIDGSTALVAGVLIGVFVYWGWDSAVTVNEETEDASHAPGRAAVVSTLILLGLYLLMTTAAVAWLGADGLAEYEDETAFDAIAGQALGSPLDKLVVLAVLTSALASTQTTVLPSSRTALSMARAGAAPHGLATIHPRFLTPSAATYVVAALAIAFYVGFRVLSEAFYEASLAALGLLICINYGLNGLACAVYYRRALGRSLKTAVIAGVLPLIGFALFAAILVKSTRDFAIGGLEDTTYWFGLQAPLVITLGLFLVAGIIIVGTRSTVAREFFARRREVAPADTLDAAAGDESFTPPPLALASRDSRAARIAAGEAPAGAGGEQSPADWRAGNGG